MEHKRLNDIGLDTISARSSALVKGVNSLFHGLDI